MKLAAEGITKRHGDRDVLVDCTLAVNTGECLILRGPSGGGKSTLLRILALLETADKGSVVHGARRVNACGPIEKPAYPFLTMVFQQLFLWPNLTMSQNLALVLHGRPHARLEKSEVEMLERFSVLSLLQRLPHECSLGEQQRIAIARALLSQAQFLLLDEPSSALDRANRDVLTAELLKVAQHNRGLLIVTHDDEGFDGISTKQVELENGHLMEVKRAHKQLPSGL